MVERSSSKAAARQEGGIRNDSSAGGLKLLPQHASVQGWVGGLETAAQDTLSCAVCWAPLLSLTHTHTKTHNTTHLSLSYASSVHCTVVNFLCSSPITVWQLCAGGRSQRSMSALRPDSFLCRTNSSSSGNNTAVHVAVSSTPHIALPQNIVCPHLSLSPSPLSTHTHLTYTHTQPHTQSHQNNSPPTHTHSYSLQASKKLS